MSSIPGGEPICMSCSNCLMIKRITGRRYEIDCKANPNLGGVTISFFYCCSYKKK